MLAITAELLLDINPSSTSVGPGAFTEFRGLAFFTADDGSNGRELWQSDGTTAGTRLFKDINSGPGHSFPNQFTNINGTLFFRANDGVHGSELWKTDGTVAGTVMVKDINPTGQSEPWVLTNVNGTLFFRASDGVAGYELWKSNGTAEGTVMVKDIHPGQSGSGRFAPLTNVNGTVFFAAGDNTHGYELWKSDGTASGTVLVKEIVSGVNGDSPGPNYITNVNGTAFFKANEGTSGYGLWKSDGTSGGTVLVKQFAGGCGGCGLRSLINQNGTLFFSANAGLGGSGLWKSDGTSVGTVFLSGPAYPEPVFPTNVNGTLFFGLGGHLGKTDGTPAGTIAISDNLAVWELINANGRMFFWGQTPATGWELWTSDGTRDGTVLVQDTNQGPSSFMPNGGAPLHNVNGNLFFRANDGVHGDELWIVRANNTPPVAENKTVTTPKGTAVAVALVASDLERDALTYEIVNPPEHGTLSGVAPNLIYTADPDYVGPDSFTFGASDGFASSNTATVSIAVAADNQAPTANDKIVSLAEDSAIDITLSATDPESSVLAYTIVDSPLHGRLTGTAPNLNYTPDQNYHGSDRLTFRVSDGALESNLAVVFITVTPVNDPPVAEGGVLLIRMNDTRKLLVFDDTDVDGDGLTRSVVSQPQYGRIVQEGDLFYYERPATPQLLDEFTYQVSDGKLLSNVASFTVVNFDLIVFAEDGEQTKEEWAQKLFPSVPPGATFTTTNDNPALFAEQPAIDSTGTLTFTPAPNSYGTATVTVELQTGAEGEDGEDGGGIVATFTIEVEQRYPRQNDIDPQDVNNDGEVAPDDALWIINYINSLMPLQVPPEGWPGPFHDVIGDNFISPEDALAVINVINLGTSSDGEAGTKAEGRSTKDEELSVASGREAGDRGQETGDSPHPDPLSKGEKTLTPALSQGERGQIGSEEVLELLAWDVVGVPGKRRV